MHHSKARGRGAFFTRRFDDADDLAKSIIDSDVEYVPLVKGRYDSEILALDTGSAVLQDFKDLAHVARGVVGKTRVTILLPTGSDINPTFNGHEVTPSDAIVLMPGAEAHCLCPSDQNWAAISVFEDDFEDIVRWWREEDGRHKVVPIKNVEISSIRSFVDTIRQISEELPRLFEMTDAVHSVECELLGRVNTAFSAGHTSDRGADRRSVQIVALIAKAEDYINSNLDKPLYTRDLCSALAISPRKLHEVFVAGCGMTPHAYLKARRLVLVRRALKSGEAHAVKTIALAQGFWHLGNFARDYHDQFGERPSETLHHATMAARANRHGSSHPHTRGLRIGR